MTEQYESPELVLVGAADDVVFGPPHVGFDGVFGMIAADFDSKS